MRVVTLFLLAAVALALSLFWSSADAAPHAGSAGELEKRAPGLSTTRRRTTKTRTTKTRTTKTKTRTTKAVVPKNKAPGWIYMPTTWCTEILWVKLENGVIWCEQNFAGNDCNWHPSWENATPKNFVWRRLDKSTCKDQCFQLAYYQTHIMNGKPSCQGAAGCSTWPKYKTLLCDGDGEGCITGYKNICKTISG